MMVAAVRISRTRCILPANESAVLHFDIFIRGLSYLSGIERDRLLIAGGEIVDNLVAHGEVGPLGIAVMAAKRSGGLTLGFFVETHETFARFSARIAGRPLHACSDGPRYDHRERRWHGLGLTMIANLARSVHYRPGQHIDRVFLEFDADGNSGPALSGVNPVR